MLRRSLLCALPWAAACAVLRRPVHAQAAYTTNKLIHFGWGTPAPTELPARLPAMQSVPFDGLVLDPVENGKPNLTSYRFSWQFWGTKTLPEAAFADSTAVLSTVPMGRFSENWLRVNVTPGGVDWFDDDAYEVVLANAETAGRMVRQCKLRGIFFDDETYHHMQFQYPQQARYGTETFEAYQERVRFCGQEFMRAVKRGFPQTKFLLAYGYYLAWRPPIAGGSLATSKYGLLPSFLDGMLDAIGPVQDQLMYDGWETAYGYKTEAEFKAAYDLIRQKCQSWAAPSVQVKFGEQYKASYGIWVDYRSGTTYPWNQTDFSQNYFTPEQFETTVRLALRYSSKYVWIYNNVDWWTGQIPQPYVDALARAKNV